MRENGCPRRTEMATCQMSRRPAIIPPGSWPRRMSAALAAGYCGESFVEDFLSRVGKDYPVPRVAEGRRRLWLKDDLDAAIVPGTINDIAEDL